MCAALVPAGPAAAQAPSSSSPEGRSLAVAEAAWGLPEHCRASGVRVVRRPLPGNVVGYAGRRCTIDVNSRLGRPPFRALCTVVVHEYGHVAGYGHIRNRRDIMHPDYATGPYWGPCLGASDRATARRRGVAVDDSVNRGSYPRIGRPGVDGAGAGAGGVASS